MHMMSVWIEFGVSNHRRDRVERFFSRSVRVVCLQSSVALDQRRRLESGYKHGQVRSHLSDDNAARFDGLRHLARHGAWLRHYVVGYAWGLTGPQVTADRGKQKTTEGFVASEPRN